MVGPRGVAAAATICSLPFVCPRMIHVSSTDQCLLLLAPL